MTLPRPGPPSSALDPDAVARSIVDHVRTLLRAHHAVLFDLEPESGELITLAVSGEPGPVHPPRRVFPGGGLARVAVRQRGPAVTADVLADPRVELTPELRAQVERGPFRVVLAVPLLVEGRVIGALGVADRAGRQFEEDDVRLAEACADHAALALENARLRQETERQRREAEVVGDVARAINASLDLDTILRGVAKGIRDLCAADLSAVAVREPGSGAMVFWHRPGARQPVPDIERVEPGRSLGGLVLLTGRPVRTDDYAADPRFDQAYVAAARAEGAIAAIAVPVESEGRVEALLYAGNRSHRPFTTRDEAVLLRLADHAAAAIRNGQAFAREQAARALAEASQARLASVLDIAADAIITVDADQRIRAFNAGAQQIFGYRPEEALGQPLDLLLPPRLAEAHRRHVREFAAAPEAARLMGARRTVWGRRLDGSEFPAEASISELGEGGQTTFTVILRDATARHQAEASARALLQVGRDLAGTADPTEAAEGILAGALAVLRVRRAALFWPDPGSGALVCVAAAGEPDPAAWTGRILSPGPGLGDPAPGGDRPVWSADALADDRLALPGWTAVRLRWDGDRALAAVRLDTGGQGVGLLLVRDVAGRVFTDEDLASLSTFAGLAAAVLGRTRAEAGAVLGRRAAEELARVTRMLVERRDVTAIGEQIADSVRGLFRVQSSSVRLLRPDGALVAIAWRGDPAQHFGPGFVQPAGEGVVGRAAAEGRAVHSPDILEDPTLVVGADLRRRIAAVGHRSVLAVPLRVGGTVIGVLGIADRSVRLFSAAEVALAQAFADQAALALEDARLREETEGRRREAEAAAQRLAGVLDIAPDAIVSTDEAQRIVLFNKGAERTFGYRAGEVLGQPLDLLLPERFAEGHRRHVRAFGEGPVAARRMGERGEVTGRRRDGSEFPAEVSISRLTQGGVTTFTVILREVTERKRAEATLRESEERFRSAFEHSAIGMAIQGLDGRYLRVNRALAEMLGRSEADLVGTDFRAVSHPDDLAADEEHIRRALRGEARLQQREKRYLHRLGHVVWASLGVSLVSDARGAPLCFVVQAQDVTARKALEEELRQAQKMEAIGRLAGGVAHDFNNLLAVVMGYSELLVGAIGEGDPLREAVKEINKAAARAAELTRQLLAFSRRQILEPRVVDLNALVAPLSTMLRRLIGETIVLVTRPGASLWPVQVDPGQVEQVIVNLVVNARDAMPRGGQITLETANVELDEALAGQRRAARPGPHVMLAVSDTGAGMGPDVLAHIFEPFFTTKEVGRGTGLGLATVYGVVAQHQGHLTVESEPGRGTTFRIFLPRAEGAADRVETPAAPAAPAPGTETILLAEDEPSVRTLIHTILTAIGYVVLETAGGDEALRIAGTHEGRIDLLVTDVVMPRMSGRELAQRIAAFRPGTRVLYMSGYTDETIARHGLVDTGVVLVQKPFTPDALARKVREVLDAPGAHPR